jgi:hypothetical protein
VAATAGQSLSSETFGRWAKTGANFPHRTKAVPSSRLRILLARSTRGLSQVAVDDHCPPRRGRPPQRVTLRERLHCVDDHDAPTRPSAGKSGRARPLRFTASPMTSCGTAAEAI